LSKRDTYGSQRCDEFSDESENEEDRRLNKSPKKPSEEVWMKPHNIEVKLIDFGGATHE